MKINEKFELYLITKGCDNLENKEKYSISKKSRYEFEILP